MMKSGDQRRASKRQRRARRRADTIKRQQTQPDSEVIADDIASRGWQDVDQWIPRYDRAPPDSAVRRRADTIKRQQAKPDSEAIAAYEADQRRAVLASLALVRPLPRPHGVGAVVHHVLLGGLGTDAATLIGEVAGLRAHARQLIDDIGRTLKQATIKDHEITRFRHGIKRLLRSIARVRNCCAYSPLLADVGAGARLLAAYLRGLRDTGPYMVRVRDGHLTATRAEAQAILDALVRTIDAITIDMSAVDLSSLRAIDPGKLTNIIWTDDTHWSPSVIDHVRRRSRILAPGLYQVTATPLHQ